MKKRGIFLGMFFLLSFLLTLSAVAQPSTSTTLPGLLLSTESILGSNIKDPQGEEVGEVKQLMIDPQTGLVKYAVVSVGGLLGMGEKTIIVPWNTLEVARDGRSVVLNASKQLLQDAPEYKQGKESEVAERNQSESTNTSSGKADTQSEQVYDPKKERTINGKVVSVETGAPMEGMPAGLQMQVKTDETEATRVYVGPEWYVQRQGMELRDNTDVQVTGALVTLNEQSVLMARAVEFGGQTLTLRDEKGKPLWSGHGNEAKQPGQGSGQR
jgi:sporulation protein YlmC with PRC-barrel domain